MNNTGQPDRGLLSAPSAPHGDGLMRMRKTYPGTPGDLRALDNRAAPDIRTRRQLMAAMAGLPMVAGTPSASAADTRVTRPAPPVLVAFFSRSGNTRVIAGLLSRTLGATLFEIVPARPYPDDYLETVEQARQERDRGFEPPLKAQLDISPYATVFLGMPIWGETAPPPVRSFLSSHDLSGKTVIPFITHGGYGLGSSQRVIARHAPKAKILPPFSLQADQERQTMERVNAWLGKLPATTT